MKSLALVTSFFLLVCSSYSTTETRRDGTYAYRENELQWDKHAFDRPPEIVGGYSELVRHISYPSDLRARRVQGSAKVTVSLDASGHVASISFAPHIPSELEHLVTSAVRVCRWKPGQRHGKSTAGRVWFPVRFVAPSRDASNHAMERTADRRTLHF